MAERQRKASEGDPLEQVQGSAHPWQRLRLPEQFFQKSKAERCHLVQVITELTSARRINCRGRWGRGITSRSAQAS